MNEIDLLFEGVHLKVICGRFWNMIRLFANNRQNALDLAVRRAVCLNHVMQQAILQLSREFAGLYFRA